MDAQGAIDLVKAWVVDTNIDYISPQMYTTGGEGSPDFQPTMNCHWLGCRWELYTGMVNKMIPSIVGAYQYPEVEKWFLDNWGVQCVGYIEWEQSERGW